MKASKPDGNRKFPSGFFCDVSTASAAPKSRKKKPLRRIGVRLSGERAFHGVALKRRRRANRRKIRRCAFCRFGAQKKAASSNRRSTKRREGVSRRRVKTTPTRQPT